MSWLFLIISRMDQNGASVCPSWQQSKHCTLARPPWFKKVENGCERVSRHVSAFWVDVTIALEQPAATYRNLPQPATLATSPPSFRCRDWTMHCHLGRNCWLRWLVVVLLAHLLKTIYYHSPWLSISQWGHVRTHWLDSRQITPTQALRCE